MTKRRIAWAIAALFVASGGLSVAVAIEALSVPPTGTCVTDDVTALGGHSISPRLIVAQPWLGKHHVYAEFAVPAEYYSPNYSAFIYVGDYYHDLADMAVEDSHVDTAGHFTRRVFLQTRVTLRFLVTGHFGDINTRCYWALRFVERGER